MFPGLWAMGGKEQKLLRTRASFSLAVLYGALTTLEFLVEDEGLDWERVTFSWSLKDELVYYPERLLESGRVEFYHSDVGDDVYRRYESGSISFDVVLRPGFGDSSIRNLYRASIDLLMLDKELFRHRAVETSLSGIEYMFIYLETGEVAMFEGERYRVRLPFVSSTANLHTHPEKACGLSKPDVESALDLLVEGGLIAASATPSCVVYLVRVYMVSEDDYTRIKEALYYNRPIPASLKSLEYGVLGY